MKKILSVTLGLFLSAGLVVEQPVEAADKKVRAQMAGAFPSSTAILGAAQLRFVKLAKEMSAGTLDIKFFEPGALVPGSQYFDAVSNGSLDMAYTAAGYFTGKDIVFAMFTTVPFGPGPGEFLAWYEYGGGNALMEEIHGKFNIVSINCGLIAPEASGWFREEIKSLDNLKGLKMRFFGLGANVMQKLGVATQLLQAGEIFQALQLGTIDATEFSMPTMDLTLGFHQVAKHYYFPGWHQQSSIGQLYVSKKKWGEFSKTQQEIIRGACSANMLHEFAESEAKQFGAMQELKAKGVMIHQWPKDMLDAFHKAWLEVVEEQKKKSENFARVWKSYSAFRDNYKIWKDNGYLQ